MIYFIFIPCVMNRETGMNRIASTDGKARIKDKEENIDLDVGGNHPAWFELLRSGLGKSYHHPHDT